MRVGFAVLAVLAACGKSKLELEFQPTCAADPARYVESITERVTEIGTDAEVFARGGKLIVALPKDTPVDIVTDLSALVLRSATLDVKIVDNGTDYAAGLGDRIKAYPDAAGIAAYSESWPSHLGNQTDTFLYAERDSTLRALFTNHPELAPPAHRVLAFGRTSDDRGWRTYVLMEGSELDPTTIVHVIPSYDTDLDHPVVRLDLDAKGARQMIDLASRSVGKRVAALLDGKVKAALAITAAPPDGHVFSFGIEGPDVKTREMRRDDLVSVLRVGSLPCPLRRGD